MPKPRHSIRSAVSSTARTCSAATSASPTPAAATPRPRSWRRIRSPAKMTEVLWVKGSGGDLRTSKRENFASLYQQKLIELQELYAARSDKGLKSAAEDDMVAMYTHATFNLNPRASSIDTPLHSFIAGEARRSHASECDHRDRGIGEPRAADAGNFRRRDGLCPVDATRVRARLGDAENLPRPPEGKVDHDGPARFHLVGQRRQGVLYLYTRLYRARRRVRSKRNTPRRVATRRRSADRNIKRSRRNSGARLLRRSCRGCAARFRSNAASSARCRTTRRSCGS